MPIRQSNPFTDLTTPLRKGVNSYVEKLIAAEADPALPVLHGPRLKDYAQRWRQAFTEAGKAPSRLILEIGCHNGDCLAAMARDFADDAFIGIDITFKRVVQTAEKLKDRGLTNGFSVLANAHGLPRLFGRDELDGIFIFFPDPWNKKERQVKHRLLKTAFVEELSRMLRPGGFVWVKTDQFSYYLQIAQAMAAAGLASGGDDLDIARRGYQSRFERHFAEEKAPYFEGIWVKSLTSS